MLASARKRGLALLLTFAMVMGMLPVSVLAADESNNGTVELKVGESITLSGAESAMGHEWWSDDGSIAAVDSDGTVTGLSAGETTVYHRYYEAEAVEVPVASTPTPVVAPTTTPTAGLPTETVLPTDAVEATDTVKPTEEVESTDAVEPTETVESTDAGSTEETDAETGTDAETDTETGTETETDAEAGTDAETDTETGAETETDAETGTDAETDTETGAETETDAETGTDAEPPAAPAADLSPVGVVAGADGLDLSGLNQDASQEEPEYTVTYKYQEYVESWTVVVTEDAITGPAIEGEMEYNGVTVRVYAPENAFPEGTVLNIRPVVQEAAPLNLDAAETADTSAEEVAQAVADAMETEEADPMSMVAFDITFTDAEGNELQPTEAVSVQFDVAASSDLITEETGALQVYHVETDEDKAPVSAQPVDTATEVEDTSADQTVVVEADSFSIYAITSVKKGNQNVSITPGEMVTLTGNSGYYHNWEVTAGNSVVRITGRTNGQSVDLEAVGEGKATVTHSYTTYSWGWPSEKSEIFTVTVSEGWVVTFDDVSGTLDIDDQIVAEGGKATEPQVRTSWGDCTFGGWYTTPDCTEEFDFNDPITQNTTVYAKWTADAKVYTLLTNDVPEKGEINKAWEAKDFGPSKDDVPYFHVNVNMTKLLHSEGVVRNEGLPWYISIDTDGCGYNNATDLWKVIFSCLDAESQQKFQTFFPGSVGDTGSAFVGYVLKQQWSYNGDKTIHIDGVTDFGPPAYMVDINARLADQEATTLEPLFAEEVTDPGTQAPKYSDVVNRVNEYFASIGATNVTWNGQNTGGTYIVDGSQYNFTLEQSVGTRYGDTINYDQRTEGILYYARFELTSEFVKTISSTVEVTKTVNGLSDLSEYQVVFQVYAADDTSYSAVRASGTASRFVGNSATVTLNPALPAGNYVLVEEPAAVSNYTLINVAGGSAVTETGSGTGKYQQSFTVPADGSEVQLSFTNTYEADTIDYTFTKVWNGTPTNFVVTLKDSKYDDLTVSVANNGTATVTGGNYTATVDGIPGRTWTVTVKDVPADSDYYVDKEISVGGEPVGSDDTTGEGANNGDEWWEVSINESTDTITNTHYTVVREAPTGSLKIYKTGESGALSGVEFTLNNVTKRTDTDGCAEWTGLDEGTYELKETAPEGYVGAGPWTVTVEKTPDTDPETNTAANGSKTITYTDTVAVKVDNKAVAEGTAYSIANTKVRAKIEITKTVNVEDARDTSYEFKVYRQGESTAVATLELNAANSWTAKTSDLPYGTYTITEIDPGNSGDYKWTGVTYTGTGVTDNQNKTATVTIGQNDNGKKIEVTATNNYVLNDDGVLTITKTAVNAPENASFDFTVKINGQPYQGNYKIGSETKNTTDGRITLTGGQTATISGLTRSASYEVVEDNYTASYDTTVKIGTGAATSSRTATGTISGTPSAVTYTNTYVTKSVTFTKADAAESHSPLSGAEFELRSGDTVITTEPSAANGTVTFDNVPVGVYSLWETKAPVGYEDVPTGGKDLGITVTVAKTGVTFSETSRGIVADIANIFSGGSDDSFAIVGGALTVYNTHKTANIQVSKTVTGYTPTSGEKFTFGLFTQDSNGNYKAVTDNNGKAVTIEVASGSNNTFTGLTTGVMYYVKEENADQTNYDLVTSYQIDGSAAAATDGYLPVDLTDVTMENGVTVSVSCTNAYDLETGDLTVKKTVDGTTTGEDFTIVVKLGDGTGGEVTVSGATAEYKANGVYTFTLSHNESATITDVPYTTTYTVEETKTEPFSYVVSGEVTTPAEFLGDHTVTVTNTYVTSGFVVNKVDDEGNLITTFSATFTLYDADPKDAGFDAEDAFVASAMTRGGVANFSNLAAGTYYLQETAAPSGYAKDETVWKVDVTTSGGEVNAEQVQVTVKENTTLVAQLWNSVLGFFSGKDYSSGARPVTISTATDYKERTAVLTMVNVPQVTGIKKYVATTLYTTGSALTGYAWADDKAEFEDLLPETETVTVLYKVVVTGAPGADYDVTDTLKDTTGASYTVTPLPGTVTAGEIPQSGSVELYYTAELTPTTSRKIYTNTAANGTIIDDAKVYLKKQTYPQLKVTIRYWFQDEYGVYELSNYSYNDDYDQTRYLTSPGSSVVAANNTLAPAPNGYELSTRVQASPAEITYANAYAEYKTNGTTQWYMNIYYDLKNPTAMVQASKGWSHSYVTADGQSINSPFQSQMQNVTYELQRTTTPNDEASWKTYKTSTFKVSTTGSSSTSWFNVELYETGTANMYSYRVVETHINGTELTGENRVLGYAPEESSILVNDGNGLTEKRTYYVTIQNEYEPELQPVQDGAKVSFTVVKLDEAGEPLANAEFTLTDDSGAAVGEPQMSNAEGEITFADLTDGTYHLEETDAPTNYKKSTSKWTIVVAKDELVYGAPDKDNHVTVTQNYSIEEISGSKDQETTKDYTISGSTITVSDERLTTPDTAGLTITKTVTGDVAEDKIPTDDEFTFTVESVGGSYELNGETVEAGSKTITLTKTDATVTLTNIEYGTTFTITEAEDAGYTLTGVTGGTVDLENGKTTVTIDETTTGAAVAFTNHYVTKGFTIVKEDAENHLYLPGAEFTVYEYANGEKGDEVLTTEPTALNVETFAQESSVSNLPVGTYWMEETTAPENYVLSNEAWIITVTKDDITVEKAEPSIGEQAIQFFTGSDLLAGGKLTVDNTPAEYKLTITKTVTGIPERDKETFTHTYYFNVFRGKNFAEKLTTEPIAVTVNYDEDYDKITGSTTITSKDYSWLKADEYLVLEDTATADTETYELTADSVTSKTVTLTQDQSQATIEATAELTNDYDRMLGGLSITKALDGETTNEKLRDEVDDKEYTFVITAPSDEVMDYGNGTYATSTTDGTTTTTGTTNFKYDEEAKVYTATVTAKIGETVTISELPTGTYTVTEDKTSADVEYWELDVTGEDDVEVTNNGTAEITVTNTYTREVPPVNPPEDQLTTLTITKVVKDSRGGDLSALAAGKNYYFRITGKDVYGDVPLTENVTVTGANSVDVDLIWGSYKVTEVDANGNPIGAGSAAEIDGYQWNKVEYTNHEDINLDKNNTAETAIATNIYEPVPMDIPVVKTWSGDYSILPNNIEVALYADGNDTGRRLTLNSGDRIDATHWLGVFESTDSNPLYRYADGGKEIVYSVVETEMNGQAITGSSIGYWDIATGRTTAGAAGLTGYDADALVLTVRNDYDVPEGDDDDDPPAPPTTPGTPSPSPSEEVNIPEDDTPLGDLPEEVPEDVEDIPDDDTPLSDLPDDPDNSDETNIFEEGVPMGDLPQTGSQGDYTPVDPTQTLGMMALAASLMAAGLLVLIGRRKDEETEQDD